MKKTVTCLALVASMFILSQCSNMNTSTNSITRCQDHCRDKGMLIDFDQTQLQGKCVCDWEKEIS